MSTIEHALDGIANWFAARPAVSIAAQIALFLLACWYDGEML